MYAMAIGLRLALFLCVGSVLLPVASAAQADDQSLPRSVSVCTPTAWQQGCTSPINLRGYAGSMQHGTQIYAAVPPASGSRTHD